MNKNRNRKRGKIDKLPYTLREAVDMMVQNPADYTYDDIVAYIRENGFEVSRSAVGRYAQSLNASLENVMLISENFRAINDELQKYPELDTVEALCRVTSYKLLEAVQSMPVEDLKDSDALKLIAKVPSLVRAVSYKADMTQKMKDVGDLAYDALKDKIFEDMRSQDPELYNRFLQFVKSQQGGDG